MKKLIAFLLFLSLSVALHAQELVARVVVQAPQVPNMDKRGTDLLQNVIRDFLNSNKWSNENYQPQERISCSVVITITAWDGNSAYKAEAQIQSSRPVYGTSYNSTLLSFNDKDFDFNYTEGQPIDFSEQNYISNLGSLLAYYAFTMIGLDKDSFSNLGGTAFYSRALNVVNVAQTAGNKGWKAVDGLRNRFWLNQNLLDNTFTPLRSFIYEYHIKGLDQMQVTNNRGFRTVLALLPLLQQLDRQKLGSIFPYIYFSAKADEIINLMKLGDPQDRI
ncbi:MAG: DUF4835 family protein, partial [Sphingobacteriales bacterium]